MGLFPFKNFQFQELFKSPFFLRKKTHTGGCPATDHFVEVLDPDGQAIEGWGGWFRLRLKELLESLLLEDSRYPRTCCKW